METIVILVLVAVALLAAEVFLPGMVLGMLGAICLVIAIAVGYAQFGPLTGTIILTGIAIATSVGFVIWLFTFPKTYIGRRLTLGRSLVSGDDKPRQDPLLGKEGVSLTPLRPAGTALVDGHRVDVVAEGELIDRDEPVSVVLVEGTRVVVRRKA
jgi:membrane-bound serine protease (ClpP class)